MEYVGEKVRVHWHVTARIYSIEARVRRDGKSNRRVVGYAPCLTLDDAAFRIDAYNLRKFQERPSRRTVHALVVGVIVSFDAVTQNGETVLCRPHVFHDGTFRRACDLRIARSASRIILHGDKRIEAIGLVADQDPPQE
jgi:hypothetical protein